MPSHGTATWRRVDLQRQLQRHFGFSSFRPYQEEIVRSILDERDVFAALPTGGGKSLCFQLPALLSDGPTIVVSPLIALMKDQVDNAQKKGVPAAFLNSTLSPQERHETWREFSSGRIKLLYTSPERLAQPELRKALGRVGIRHIAVDEAHCISEWGHEFRPDYRALGVLRKEFPQIPIAAFTATATRQVQGDIIKLLGLTRPVIVRGSFDRPEIFYRVAEKRREVDEQILAFVRARPGSSGIVYRSTRKATEETAGSLSAHGIASAAYHAGVEDEERRRRQEAFLRGEVQVVVATIAFGMGVDKADVRWVIHGDLPRSLEGYYQETGRAGRDGKESEAVLYYRHSDIALIRWQIGRIESSRERSRAESRLQDVLRYVGSSICRRRQLLAHFDEAYAGGCQRCDLCAGETSLEDRTVDAQKVLSAALRTGELFGAHYLADVVAGNGTERILANRHDVLPTFGVGRDRERSYWLSLTQDLASLGYLVRGEGRAAGFRLTERGRLLVKGEEAYRGIARSDSPRASRRGSTGKPGAAPVAPVGAGSADRERSSELLSRLKLLRARLAKERHVAAFVIFSNRTLEEIAGRFPSTEAELLECPGVGPKKLADLGALVLQEVRRVDGGV